MIQKEMDILYDKMSIEFDKAMQKKEYPKLSKITYALAYTITRLLLCFFG